jgi:hypothetical protein
MAEHEVSVLAVGRDPRGRFSCHTVVLSHQSVSGVDAVVGPVP